jgi:glycosyltransferase involved in cell wall biosynthesis
VFRPEKGVEYFLEMARLVHARAPQVRFLAVGGDSAVEDIGWLDRMKHLANELGVDRLVCFPGSRDDIQDIMHSIDVLVVPSLDEGFGRVIVEAAAAGVPAVGANAAGIPEVVRDGQTGLLVPPRDGAAIATAVLRMLDDEGWRRQLGESARSNARERFAPARQIAELQSAWADALTHRR